MPTYSFCNLGTYELLTGIDVPTADHLHIQAILDLHSSLVATYLGPTCVDRVSVDWPEVLAGMVAYRTYRGQTIPAGVQSESVGSSSVSYVTGGADIWGLLPAETALLDNLCGRISAGRGIGSVSFAEAAFITTLAPAARIERIALAQGWPTVWLGWAKTNRADFFYDDGAP